MHSHLLHTGRNSCPRFSQRGPSQYEQHNHVLSKFSILCKTSNDQQQTSSCTPELDGTELQSSHISHIYTNKTRMGRFSQPTVYALIPLPSQPKDLSRQTCSCYNSNLPAHPSMKRQARKTGAILPVICNTNYHPILIGHACNTLHSGYLTVINSFI